MSAGVFSGDGSGLDCDLTTTLLRESAAGSSDAARTLIPHIYNELHELAHRHRARERAGFTLSTTGLVHEAYLKLVNQQAASWQDRRHFVALASRAIRQILIDYARARGRKKRQGHLLRVELEEDLLASTEVSERLAVLADALNALEAYEPRLARLVEIRFFGGLTMEESALELGISLRTAERAWFRARTFLFAYVGGDIETER